MLRNKRNIIEAKVWDIFDHTMFVKFIKPIGHKLDYNIPFRNLQVYFENIIRPIKQANEQTD